MFKKNQKKILVMLFNNFTKDNRVLKECLTLIEQGHYVELWALYDKDLPEKEVISGIVVKRKFKKKQKKLKNDFARTVKLVRRRILSPFMTVLKPFPSVYSASKRVFNFFEKITVRLVIIVKPVFKFLNLKKILKTLRKKTFDFDVVHCHDLLPLPLGASLKKEHGHLKLVYDSHEYHIETSNVVNDPVKRKYLGDMERENIVYVDQVIVASPSMPEEFGKLYGIKEVTVVKNCPNLSVNEYRSDHFRQTFNIKKEDIIFLHQGALVGKHRGIEEIIQCFAELYAQGKKNYHIVFMGFGNLVDEIKELTKKYSNFHFHDAVKPEEIPQVSSSADYGIIFTPNTCKNHYFSMPNKLFEYISCGLPVITSPLLDLEKIVAGDHVGYVTNGYTATDLMNTIQQIHSSPTLEMRAHILKLHMEKYNWNIEKDIFLKMYSDLLAHESRTVPRVLI